MILLNLLPHRALARQRRRQGYHLALGWSALLGVLFAVGAYLWLQALVTGQQSKNSLLQNEITQRQAQVKEITILQAEMAALGARQAAIERLKGERNLTVHLLNELARQLPDGVYITSLKQDQQMVMLQGMAQSNERVSELLRQLGSSGSWLLKPELIEITSTHLSQSAHDQRRVASFKIRIGLKQPTDSQPNG